MKRIVLWLSMLLTLFFFSGCATTEKANLAEFDSQIFPATTLVFTSESLQYSDARYALISALKESNTFVALDVENPYSEYALELNIDYGNKIDNPAEAVATGVALGAIVVPVRMDYIVSGDIRLRKGHRVVDHFTIEFEHRRIQTLFQGVGKDGGWSGALRVAAQKIIENLDRRNSYGPTASDEPQSELALHE